MRHESIYWKPQHFHSPWPRLGSSTIATTQALCSAHDTCKEEQQWTRPLIQHSFSFQAARDRKYWPSYFPPQGPSADSYSANPEVSTNFCCLTKQCSLPSLGGRETASLPHALKCYSAGDESPLPKHVAFHALLRVTCSSQVLIGVKWGYHSLM